MGIFDKIRSVLSELEKTGTSSNKSSVTPSAKPSETPGNAPGGTPQSAAAPIGAPTGMAMQAQAKAAAEAHKRMIEAASDPTMSASRMGVGMMSMVGPGAMPGGMGAAPLTGMAMQAQAKAAAETHKRMIEAASDPTGMPGGMPGYMGAAPVMGMPMGSPGGMAGMGMMSMAKTDPFPWPGSARPNIYAPGITIGEQVLLNEEGITVTALAYDINPAMDDFIKVKIENATYTPVTVICSNVIVNGYCVSPIGLQCLAAPQPAGKEKYVSVALGVWKLEAAGLNAVGQIDFHLSIMCMTASGMNKIDKDVTIRTSAYDHMDKEIKDPGKELIVCDGVRVFSKYVGEGSAFPTSYATICLENNSGGKRVIFFNCCYHDGDSGQRIISSNMLLEDGNKSLFILPVTNVQSVENIEVNLQVTPPGILNLPKPEKLQIPLS